MAEQFRVILHPALARQVLELESTAAQDPGGPVDREYQAVLDGLEALRDGREAEFGGERLGFSEKHADLRDCAEIKVPVIEEFNRRGRPMGSSHRLTYREFDSLPEDPRPVRQAIAFEPRKDGRPFGVTADRLGRQIGRSIEEFEALPNVEPIVGPDKDPQTPTSPVRRPLPPDLVAAVRAASNPSPAAAAATPPREAPTPSRRTDRPGSGRGRAI